MGYNSGRICQRLEYREKYNDFNLSYHSNCGHSLVCCYILRRDLQIPTVIDDCAKLSVQYQNRLNDRPNEPAMYLLIHQPKKRLNYDSLDIPQRH